MPTSAHNPFDLQQLAAGWMVVVVAFGCGGLASSARATAAVDVQWSRGLLSVKSEGKPLSDVLTAVQQRTGIVLKGEQALRAPAHVNLHNVRLLDGLHALLAGHSYLLIDGSGGTGPTRQVRVYIVPGRAQQGAAMAPARRAVAANTATFGDGTAGDRIEAVERLAEGSDEASLLQLQLAATDSNEAVRAVARAALRARQPAPSQ